MICVFLWPKRFGQDECGTNAYIERGIELPVVIARGDRLRDMADSRQTRKIHFLGTIDSPSEVHVPEFIRSELPFEILIRL